LELKQKDIDKVTNKLNQLSVSSAFQIDQLNKDLKKTINQSEKTINELYLDIEKKNYELDLKQSTIEKLTNDINQLKISSRSRKEELTKELKSTVSKLECRNQKVETLTQIVADKNDEYSVISNEVKSLKLMLENTNDTLQKKEKIQKELNFDIKEKQKELDLKQSTIEELTNNINQLKASSKSRIEELTKS
jgi:uncharacterized coiled-coil DUF342 family protein